MPLFAILLLVAGLSFPVGYAIVLHFDLRKLSRIMGVGIVLYVIDAHLLATGIMLSEPYPEGLASPLLDVMKLAMMGVLLTSPIGVPLVISLAFMMRELLRRREAEALSA